MIGSRRKGTRLVVERYNETANELLASALHGEG